MRYCGCMAVFARKVIGVIFCAFGIVLAVAVSMMIWILAALPDYECAWVFGVGGQRVKNLKNENR